jgi:hypothetical protein
MKDFHKKEKVFSGGVNIFKKKYMKIKILLNKSQGPARGRLIKNFP